MPSNNIQISQSTNIYAVITLGSGGAGDTSGVDYAGGNGANGVASISSVLGGTTAFTLDDTIPQYVSNVTGAYQTPTSDNASAHFIALAAAKTNDYPLIKIQTAATTVLVGDANRTVQKIRAVWKVM